ncbi:response regulator [Alcaligenaceae bacterium]|nr:response regulator [Alcaligenaceae bacterium]
MAQVMLVEDDTDLRLATTETLELAGFQVQGFETARPALAALHPDFPGLILSDLRMPGLSGLDFLDQAQKLAPDVPFILITAHGDVPAAIRAMRAGAHDFLEKPCPPELMLDVLRRAQAMRSLQLENNRLRDRLDRNAALLVTHFATHAAARHDLPKIHIDDALRLQLARHDWPGYDAAMDDFESRLLRAALMETGGRKAEAASLLGIPRKRLYLRLRHHNMLEGTDSGQK